jgi:hypothetical protein
MKNSASGSRRSRLHAPALALAGALLGCGQASSLSGSIGGTLSLGFDTVDVRRLATSYVVVYQKGSETTARLTYTPPPGSTIQAAQVLELDFSATAGKGNAALSRASADRLQFPEAEGGTLTFDVAPDPLVAGDPVSGRFGVRFKSGQTLSGVFSAPLSVAAR